MSKLADQGKDCLNCGSELQGEYCHVCGQKALDKKHESFWKTMGHFSGDFVHFDSQIFRTAVPLLFKPGFLTNEYLMGKRTQYLNPLKMYVFLSFLFFFLTFSMRKEEQGEDVQVNDVQLADSSLQETLDSVSVGTHDQLNFSTKQKYGSLSQYDSVQQAQLPEKRDGFLTRSFIRKVLQTKARVEKEGSGIVVNEMIDAFKHNFPKLAFLLLPFFALLLKLFFRKKKMYYMEHLVFSVYFYNFFFLSGSIIILLSLLFPKAEAAFYSFFYWALAIYFYIALKKVYDNGWIKTFFKLSGFALFFIIIAGWAMLVNMFVTFLTV